MIHKRVLLFYNNISAGHTSLLQVYKCYWLRRRLVVTFLLEKLYCKLEQEGMFLVP